MARILLKNIFIDHIIVKEEEEYHDLEEIVITNNVWEELEQLPQLVENKTELACWCCGLFFTSKPWGIPIFISNDVKPTKNTDYKLHHNTLDSITREELQNIKWEGNFCTIFCACLFLEETTSIPESCKNHYRKLLYFVYGNHCNRRISWIPLAEPKHRMRMYCGNDGWSEQEFRERNRAKEREIL